MQPTPAQRAKHLGAKSLAKVAEHWGTTVQALHYQHKANPKKFEIIVRGVVSLEADHVRHTIKP